MSLRLALRRIQASTQRSDWKELQENVRKRAERTKKFDLQSQADKPLWKRMLLPAYLGTPQIDDYALGILFFIGGTAVLLVKFVLKPSVEALKEDTKENEELDKVIAEIVGKNKEE